MTQKAYHSFVQFQKECFPNKILERLEDKLQIGMMTKTRLEKNEDNPKTGTLAVREPFSSGKTLTSKVQHFYMCEGFTVIQDTETSLQVTKEDEKYSVGIYPHDLHYIIRIGVS